MVGSPPLSLNPPKLGLGSEPSHLDLCPSHPALSPCHSVFSIFMNIRRGGHGRGSCGPGMQLWDALPFVSMSVQVLRAGHCSPLQELLWPRTSLSHSWPQLRPWAPAQLPAVSGPSLGAEGEGRCQTRAGLPVRAAWPGPLCQVTVEQLITLPRWTPLLLSSPAGSPPPSFPASPVFLHPPLEEPLASLPSAVLPSR